MSLKTIKIDSGVKRAVLTAAAAGLLAFGYYSAKWTFAHTVAIRSETPEVAALAADLAPDDPQTHYVASVFYEQTFIPDDIERSLSELEKAAAASPNDYQMWLALGRARERNGDETGGEAALRRAQALAPNYARIQWALGNALLRQGRTDEGFAEIRHAVAGDPAFTDPAASAAWTILDGDLAQVRGAIGDSPQLNASLAKLLAGQKRFDDAFEIWKSLPQDDSPAQADARKNLYQNFLAAKRFRLAALTGTSGAAVGAITNPGFENAIKKKDSTPFEWQVQETPGPLIGQTDGQKHGGNFSLLVSFGNGTKDFRRIEQTVAVEPDKTYELHGFYKAGLKTSTAFRIEISDAGENKSLASSSPLANSDDWAPLGIKFTVPPDTDGVVIRLVRENCTGDTCSVSGSMWFDDFRLVESAK